MTDIILFVVMMLFTGVQAFATVFIFYLVLEPRYFGKKLTLMLGTFLIMVLNFISQFFPYALLAPLVFYILWFLILQLLYKGKVLDKAFLLTCLCTLQMLYEGLYFETYEVGITFQVEDKYSFMRAWQLLLVIVICIFQTILILWLKKQLQQLVESVVTKIYFVFFAQFAIVYAALSALVEIYMVPMQNGFQMYTGTTKPYIFGIPLFVIATVCIVFVLMNTMVREYERSLVKIQNHMTSEVIELYKQVKKKNEHIRKIRHDIKNHLRVTNDMIKIDTEKSLQYISLIEKEIEEL